MVEEGRTIRLATAADIDGIMAAIDAAKGIMRSIGNHKQWADGYPSEEAIFLDIDRDGGYVIEENGRIEAYFAFLPSPEPTYGYIEGEWLDNEKPYHVIHRIASYPESHGIFSDIMEYCFSHDPNIRIDTHRDNSIMIHNILKHGFTYCGIIWLASGDERLAYQRLLPQDVEGLDPSQSSSVPPLM